jgi:hypothetical protein
LLRPRIIDVANLFEPLLKETQTQVVAYESQYVSICHPGTRQI